MKHHYIPQFLLSSWANQQLDSRIEVIRLDLTQGITSSRRRPRYTGYEEDLYALTEDKIAGMGKQAVETCFLKHVDNNAANVRRKILNEGLHALNEEDRISWVRFIMSLRLRQPEIVDEIRQKSSIVLTEDLDKDPEEYEELVSDDDPASLKEWAEKHYPGLIDNFGMSIFHEIVDNEDLGDKILRLRWFLFKFDDVKHNLLLSDQPCVFTSDIDADDLIIALPIHPKALFLAVRGDKTAALLREVAPNILIRMMNTTSVSQARVRIYATDDQQLRFIENRTSSFK